MLSLGYLQDVILNLSQGHLRTFKQLKIFVNNAQCFCIKLFLELLYHQVSLVIMYNGPGPDTYITYQYYKIKTVAFILHDKHVMLVRQVNCQAGNQLTFTSDRRVCLLQIFCVIHPKTLALISTLSKLDRTQLDSLISYFRKYRHILNWQGVVATTTLLHA